MWTMEKPPIPTYAPSDPQLRMERAEKRIEAKRKLKQDIEKEIENLDKNEKHFEQQMALLQCKRDYHGSMRMQKVLDDLRQRRDFLSSPFMQKRCNDTITKTNREIEHLKYSKEVKYEIKTTLHSLSIGEYAKRTTF